MDTLTLKRLLDVQVKTKINKPLDKVLQFRRIFVQMPSSLWVNRH